jgi:hypothetical protein
VSPTGLKLHSAAVSSDTDARPLDVFQIALLNV